MLLLSVSRTWVSRVLLSSLPTFAAYPAACVPFNDRIAYLVIF